MKVKIVFIGGLTNGKIVYEYLKKNKHVDLQLAITYFDEHSGARSVSFEDSEFVIKDSKTTNHVEKIKELNPDYIIVAGWAELLSNELLGASKLGTIGFHPSKLPMDRGRAVVAWQIEEGYVETALTMFYYSDFPDGGDVIAQQLIPINENDYVNDILDKVDDATQNLIQAYFPLLRQGKAPRKKQDLNEGIFRRLRGENDSKINWNQNAKVIYNKVRAISKPYPGATGVIAGRQLKIWRSLLVEDFPLAESVKPGDLVATLHNRNLLVKM